jgi:hypothetical protein
MVGFRRSAPELQPAMAGIIGSQQRESGKGRYETGP